LSLTLHQDILGREPNEAGETARHSAELLTEYHERGQRPILARLFLLLPPGQNSRRKNRSIAIGAEIFDFL
jgi:hypothetical protein